MKNWYKSWFNTPFYHILYRDRDHLEAQRFIEKMVNFLEIPPKSKILDLACGKGRHSIYLNELGYDVIGLDLSEQSIASLKDKENDTLHFVVGDKREPYKVDYFDVVLNLFTSFGYFHEDHENLKVIKSIKASLRKSGIGVIDFLNAKKTRSALPQEEIKTIEGIDFRIRKFEKDNSVVKEITFIDDGKERHYAESVKLYTAEDLVKFIESEGMKVLNIFGDHDLNVLDEDHSDRAIVVFEK